MYKSNSFTCQREREGGERRERERGRERGGRDTNNNITAVNMC
jgi:hypothetical protein